ncbi:hypothetical protein, partial [Xylella fastidiosa]
RLSIGRASFYCLLRRQSPRPLCLLFLVMYLGTILFVGYPYRGFHLALNVPIRDFFAVLMCACIAMIGCICLCSYGEAPWGDMRLHWNK